MLLKRMIILDTFMPPPVLPAQAPMNIISTMIVLESSGHMSKSAVENPVVETIEATVNEAFLKASPTLGKRCLMFKVMTVMAEMTISANTFSSLLNTSFSLPVISR